MQRSHGSKRQRAETVRFSVPETVLQDTVTCGGIWRNLRLGGICVGPARYSCRDRFGVSYPLKSRAQVGIYEWPEACVQNFLAEHTFPGSVDSFYQSLCRDSIQAKAKKPGTRSAHQPEVLSVQGT